MMSIAGVALCRNYNLTCRLMQAIDGRFRCLEPIGTACPRWKSGPYVGQLSAVAYFYEAWSMALISPSDIRPKVASFILPSGLIKKLQGIEFMVLYGLGIIFSSTAKTG